MAHTVDSKTIARAVEGDVSAQRVLYETHFGAAFRLAYLLLRDEGDAEEVVQDTFVYLLRNLNRYDSERGSFWAWLRVALVSRCRNKLRRQRANHVSLEVLEAAGQAPPDGKASDPAGELDNLGTRRIVWEALQRVSPGSRDALVLRYYEGLAYPEIARLLGCSYDAARARVAYGKVQLRRLLVESEVESGCMNRVVPVGEVA
jgi:RNA polymerase sigma-70 factor (ECF subfamily)